MHLTGGRVVVVPSAVAQHRENFTSRQPAIELTKMSETNRVATVLSCTSSARLLPVFFQMLGLSLLELPIAIATGKWKQGVAALQATCGGVLQLASVVKRRRIVQQSRLVNDAEVHYLQVRGSARATNFLRMRRAASDARRRASFVVAKERERRQRFSVVVGCMLAAIVVVGSRQLNLCPLPSRGGRWQPRIDWVGGQLVLAPCLLRQQEPRSLQSPHFFHWGTRHFYEHLP